MGLHYVSVNHEVRAGSHLGRDSSSVVHQIVIKYIFYILSFVFEWILIWFCRTLHVLGVLFTVSHPTSNYPNYSHFQRLTRHFSLCTESTHQLQLKPLFSQIYWSQMPKINIYFHCLNVRFDCCEPIYQSWKGEYKQVHKRDHQFKKSFKQTLTQHIHRFTWSIAEATFHLQVSHN